MEYDGNTGAVLRRYVHGPGTDEPLVWYEGSGTTDRRWLHSDERGSVIAISNSAGTSIALNKYDEYGIPLSTNMGRFGYTGQTWIPELGLWYYKARIYSATLGRFMQTDPIGYKDGINWYDYVDGDPVNRVDPTGLCTGSLIANKDGSCAGGGYVAGSMSGWSTATWRESKSEAVNGGNAGNKGGQSPGSGTGQNGSGSGGTSSWRNAACYFLQLGCVVPPSTDLPETKPKIERPSEPERPQQNGPRRPERPELPTRPVPAKPVPEAPPAGRVPPPAPIPIWARITGWVAVAAAFFSMCGSSENSPSCR